MIISKKRFEMKLKEAENQAIVRCHDNERIENLDRELWKLRDEVNCILRRLDDLERPKPQVPFNPEQNRVVTVYGCPNWDITTCSDTKSYN